MFCSRCGKTLPGDGKRCVHCGMDVGEAAFSSTSYTSSPPVNWDDQEAWEVAYEEPPPTPPAQDYAVIAGQPDDIFDQTLSQISAESSRYAMEPQDETDVTDVATPDQVSAPAEPSAPVSFELPKVPNQGVSDELKRKIVAHGVPAAREEDALPPDTVSKRLHKVLIALVSLVLVLGACFLLLWINSAPKAPIEGVTQSLYAEGKELIAAHVTDENRQRMLSDYLADYSAAQQKYAEAPSRFTDMLAKISNPLANDQLFVNALIEMQNEISLASGQDYMAALQKADTSGIATPEAIAVTEKRADDAWKRVAEHFQMLEIATSSADLENIRKGASMPVGTPEPDSSLPPPTELSSLSKGKRGEAVKTLQNRLYKLGFFKGVRDGIYGDQTETAVKAFQEHVGIVADGRARVSMQQMLYSDDAPSADDPKITPTPKQADTAGTDAETPSPTASQEVSEAPPVEIPAA